MYYVDDLLIYERKETIWNHVQKYRKDWAVYSGKDFQDVFYSLSVVPI